MKKNRICVIGIYFGVFPNYMPLWLKSISLNPNVDFLIFTDQPLKSSLSNLTVVITSLKEMKELFKRKLQLKKLCLDKPYKLCDFRPAYGLIFDDYLSQYDYWGHCDFDMIFGDLNYFFKKEKLEKYQKFLSLGHLSIYKNSNTNNTVFKLTKGEYRYAHVFTTSGAFGYDEIQGIGKAYLDNKIPFFVKRIFADISTINTRFKLVEVYKLDSKPYNYNKQLFVWDNGKVFRYYLDHNSKIRREEYIYIHFKKRPNFALDFNVSSTIRFIIHPEGFTRIDRDINIDDFNKYNIYRGKIIELKEKIEWYINKIILKTQQ